MSTVIITWCSKWLWYELSKKFLQSWRDVIWISRTKPNLDIHHISADLTTKEWLEYTIKQIQDQYSSFDCMIHNIGDGNATSFANIQYSEIDRTFKINSYIPLLLSAQLDSLVRENQADIVCIGATLGLKGYQHFASYSSAKRALRWLIENLRIEYQWTQTRVIWIHPWGMDTPGNTWPWWRIDQMTTITGKPAWKLMNPEDIAEVIYHAISMPKNIELSEIIINKK